MSIDDFMEGMHILQDNYNQKFNKAKLKLFYENLKDMPKDRYLKNIKDIIKTSQFVPSIAQIRNEAPSKLYSNYEQRDYRDFDFSKIYANEQ